MKNRKRFAVGTQCSKCKNRASVVLNDEPICMDCYGKLIKEGKDEDKND